LQTGAELTISFGTKAERTKKQILKNLGMRSVLFTFPKKAFLGPSLFSRPTVFLVLKTRFDPFPKNVIFGAENLGKETKFCVFK
jgi:hypothetical protein